MTQKPDIHITRRKALRHLATGAAAVAISPLAISSLTSAGRHRSNINSVTLALVGGAHIHAPNFANRMAESPIVTTKYVWDPSREVAEERRDVTGGEIADDPSVIFQDPEVDGVVICSQTNLHAELVPQAAEAGKHLFVEKPVGLNGDEAKAIADEVNRAGVIFQTGYFMRSSGVNQKIKSLLQDSALGDITRLRLSNVHSGAIGGWFDTDWYWMTDTEQAGVGAFGDLGSHVMDLLLWFMENDSPKACTGYVNEVLERYPTSDEYGEGMVTFESGAVATIAGGWVDHANPNQIEISGTEGHLRVTNGELFLRIPDRDIDASEPRTDLPEDHKHPLELFFDVVAGEENLPLITADEAAEVNRVITEIYNAHVQGGWVQL
ncbi:gfo/Idh/MocA family oxidoreductase [Rhodohalobacter sp. SW132]|uniref:Gfo/Idh/MocA family protein n=1 Tax=Rhodohalobacter sp. SW132 TaxID=2293433 RepID=UPI000E28378E|nr:Gfo/Idh/MocA family oxidoreductase [Rhodohalobacter sp. SW132]REL33404.1 gfo/Idh/MocA family oxidoreductase [Rhodohalobacter sp. SW132]